MTKNGRELLHKKLFKQAYPATMDENKPVDLKQIYNQLQAMTGKV